MREQKCYHYTTREASAEMYVSALHEDGSLLVSGLERHDKSGWYYFCFESFTFCKQTDMSKSGILRQIINHTNDGYSEGSYDTLPEAVKAWTQDDENIQFLSEYLKEVQQ